MKSRLSSTIWTLVLLNGVILFAVLGLAYSAGRQSGGASLFDFGSLPSGASGAVMLAVLLALGMAAFMAWRLGTKLLTPVQELAQFSERIAAGDPRARVEVNTGGG
jgi:methyl-accepting chemotaxis protein